MAKLKVACLQMNSSNDIAENLSYIRKYAFECFKVGVDLMVLPECALLSPKSKKELIEITNNIEPDSMLSSICHIARQYDMNILLGSIAYKVEGRERFANRSILIDKKGEIDTIYDKIHLFDYKKGNKHYNESSFYYNGVKAVTCEVDNTIIGMTVCHDLRYAKLFRTLTEKGAKIITVPAAWAKVTGSHWEPLLKVRAIENGCFIIAPNQCGIHPGNRATHGHSMIINPQGEILKEASHDRPELLVVELDLDEVDYYRSSFINALKDREYD